MEWSFEKILKYAFFVFLIFSIISLVFFFVGSIKNVDIQKSVLAANATAESSVSTSQDSSGSSMIWLIKLCCYILFATVIGALLIHGFVCAREISGNVNDISVEAVTPNYITTQNQEFVSVADTLEGMLEVSNPKDDRDDSKLDNAVDNKTPKEIKKSNTSMRIIRPSTGSEQVSSGKGGNMEAKRIIRT